MSAQRRGGRSIYCALLAGMVCAWACGSGQRAERSAAGPAQRASARSSAVVSTVNSTAITLREVEQLVRAGLPSAEALHRLQSQSLLMTDAARRGFEREHTVQQIERQASVQALLEAETADVRIDDAQVVERYQQEKGRFEIPERRASVHVLARVAKDASREVAAEAEAFARAVIDPLAAADDLDAFLKQQRDRSVAGQQIVAERLPAVDRAAHIAKPYLDALFAASRPSVVPRPVRTSYGWHAIRLTAIEPAAQKGSYQQALEQLRSELLLHARTERVEALLQRLRREVRVEIAPDAQARLAQLTIEYRWLRAGVRCLAEVGSIAWFR